MLNEKVRPLIEPLTAGMGRGLARAHLTPNALTTIGLLATLACAVVIAGGRLVLGGLLLIPAALIDVLDGATARATGRVTAWGGFFDSVGDRVGDSAVLAAIAWASREDHATLLAVLAALVSSSLVPYARARAEAIGCRAPSGPGERGERMILLILGLVFGMVEAAAWVITALALWTFVSRCVSVRRQARG